MKKRVLAIVLSLAIAVAFMPTLAFAQTTGSEENPDAVEAYKPYSINELILMYAKGLNLDEIRASINGLSAAGNDVWEKLTKDEYSSDDLAKALEAYGGQLDNLFHQVDVVEKAVAGFQKDSQAIMDAMMKSANDQVAELQKKVDKAWGATKLIYEKQLKKAKELSEALGKLNAALLGQADKLIKKFNEGLGTVTDSFHTSLVQKIKDMADDVEAFNLDGEIAKVQAEVEKFQNNVKKQIADMKSAVGAFNEAVKEMAKNATGPLKAFYDDQSQKASELKTALDGLNAALIKQVKALEAAIEKDSVLQGLKDQIDGIKDAIKGAPNALHKALVGEINEMTAAVDAFNPEKAVGKIVDFESGLKAKIKEMNDKVVEFGTKLEEKAKTATGKAKEAIDAQLAKVNDLKKALEELNDALESAVLELDNAIKNAVVGSEWHQKVVEAMQKLNEQLDAVDEAIKAAPEELYQALLDGIKGMTAKVKEFNAEEAVAEAIDKMEQFQTCLQDKVAEMKEAVKEYCEALQEDIKAAQGKAKEALEKQLEKAKAIKAALDELDAAIQEEIEELMEMVVVSGLPEQVEALKETLAELNGVLKEKAAEMAADFHDALQDKVADFHDALQDKVADFHDALQANFEAQLEKAAAAVKIAQEQIEALIEKLENGEIDKDTFKEMFKELHNQLITAAAKLNDKLKDIAMELPIGAFIEAAKNLSEAIKAGLVNPTERIKEFVEQLKALAAMASEFAKDKMSKAVEKVLEEAKAAFDASLDILLPFAMGQLEALRDKLEAGDFDKFLAPLGITGAQLVAIADNLIDALLSDKTVAEMQDEIDQLIIVQKELSDKVDTVSAENTALKKEIEKGASAAAAFEKAWNNAKKLESKKVKIKKAKYKKKRVTVTWKKFKAAKINGYQISWKVGKKAWKNKTVKGANKTKAKTGKIKAKKKTKIKVRVRAYFTMKYKGKTQKFYSKWSKVKKTKVK